MTKPIRRTYLDFDGLCQLTWIGRLISVPGSKENIAFRAYFTQITLPIVGEKQAKRSGEAFWRDFPVGDIIDVPIGTLFYRGRPIKKNADEALSVRKSIHTLDFSAGNIRLIDRWARVATDNDDPSVPGKLLIPRAPGSLPNDPDYNGTLLCVGANGDPFAYVIPSYEVFLFFMRFQAEWPPYSWILVFLNGDAMFGILSALRVISMHRILHQTTPFVY